MVAAACRRLVWAAAGLLVLLVAMAAPSHAQDQFGSIRGLVLDADFDAPLPSAQVQVLEINGSKAVTNDQGNFLFPQVAPGRYTLAVSKEGYVRQLKSEVIVVAGQLTDLRFALSGDYEEMDEFVVEDVLQGAAGTEAALLELRLDSPALLDSISSELMSRAGASDAAGALRLVAGATVADGKTAVIRGLPDRYVSSQLGGVRLPSADEDKRAVELDQFPAAVVESIQVSKTFTPDQQGDASGGAVDVRLKGIPDETLFQIKTQIGGNSQVTGIEDFLSYRDGGVNTWGRDDGERGIQDGRSGSSWDGASGTSTRPAPTDYKLQLAMGGKRDLTDDWQIGGFLSLFYERDSSYFDDGIEDSRWVDNPDEGLTPEYSQGSPGSLDFKTSLFDITQGSESVQWGGLATLGLESEHHELSLSYLRTHTAEDVATLAEDTRGKEYYFPGYDPNDPADPGNQKDTVNAAPYLRLETLEYTERTVDSLQLRGRHELPFFEEGEGAMELRPPQLSWTLSQSHADLFQPDKRQFGAYWRPGYLDPGFPPFLPPFDVPPEWFQYKPSATFLLGNFQRIWKSIEEESEQARLDLELPFDQWSGDRGYVKFGLFDDAVARDFNQDSFSNFNDNSSFPGDYDDPWSETFDDEVHPITPANTDVDYRGDIDLTAWYGMADLPLFTGMNLIGGARVERTEIGIVVDPEVDSTWFPKGAIAPAALLPGDADVDFGQRDVLPSLGLAYEPVDTVTLRAAWSRTIARQTFKELTPILQQEYLGGPIFIGNPELGMSSLENWDLRGDWRPTDETLLSASWFRKDIDDPIEYVQRVVSFTYTTAVNYPRGKLDGVEFELRQGLGAFFDPLAGVSIGGNATFIESEVTLPPDEIAGFADPTIGRTIRKRDMTHAPEKLLNLYATWDIEASGTQFALFWTVQGDTLVAGAGEAQSNFIPDVYAKEYATLNFNVAQKLGDHFKVALQLNNLTNPRIKEVYRADGIGGDVTRTSYSKGIDYSLSFAAEFRF